MSYYNHNGGNNTAFGKAVDLEETIYRMGRMFQLMDDKNGGASNVSPPPPRGNIIDVPFTVKEDNEHD